MEMEPRTAEVEIVIEDSDGPLDRPPNFTHYESGSYSESSPCVTDSDGEDFYDAPTPTELQNKQSEKIKEKIARKTSTVKLTPELKEKIITQTELLFSDENLEKNGFLLKHVKRHKDGFVNLKLLCSLRKMRAICKEYKVVCEALKDSELLELNEECSKIRRKKALPDNLFHHPPVRFVVVSEIKTENPTMDFLSDMFSSRGQIEGVRIVRPGKKFPSDLQSHFAHHPDLAKETVAVVEFESPQVAEKVVQEGLSPSEKYGQPKLCLLRLSAKQLSKRTRTASGEGIESEDTSPSKEDLSQLTSREKRYERKKTRNKLDRNLMSHESCPSSSDNDAYYSSFSSYRRRFKQEAAQRPSSAGGSPQSSPRLIKKTMNTNSYSLGTTPDSSPGSHRKEFEKMTGRKANTGKCTRELKLSPLAKDQSPMTSPELKHKHLKNKMIVETSSLPNSPWVMRRKTYNKDHNGNLDNSNGHLNVFGFLRQPKGPDGTKGFSQQYRGIYSHA